MPDHTTDHQLDLLTDERAADDVASTGTVPVLDAAQCDAVIARTHHYIEQARELCSFRPHPVQIAFDLRGRAAGMYRVRGRQRLIRYNPHIFARYYEDNYRTTIPHEVAHYACDMLYGLRNIRPHGREWKTLMEAFGADSSVTASYDLSGLPQRRQRYFRYRCECRQHRLSATRHNRVTRRKGTYYCRHCGKTLVPED